LTGFGIFQHGGFGKPHALGVLTLVVLAAALLAEYSSLFGRASRYVTTIGNSTAFFFHFIPAATETLTRLPLGAPLLPNADAPELQVIFRGVRRVPARRHAASVAFTSCACPRRRPTSMA
jgi:hypothetical protein